MIKDADIQRLVELGFIENRAKIYLSLLMLGQASAEEVSTQTKLPLPDVRNALRELLKIGMVQEVATNKTFFLVRAQTQLLIELL